jgi:hypothetical protein
MIILGCIIGGGLLGFFGPFIVAQFLPENLAYSFVTFFTIPIGLVIGLVVGLVLVFK